MTARRDDERGADEPDALAGRAAERMLGPNPFVGLRPEDVAGAVRLIGAQGDEQPGVLLEQEASLRERPHLGAVRQLPTSPRRQVTSALPTSAWQGEPVLPHVPAGPPRVEPGARRAASQRIPLDDAGRDRARTSSSRSITDALAPTNTLLGNPARSRAASTPAATSVGAGPAATCSSDLVHEPRHAVADRHEGVRASARTLAHHARRGRVPQRRARAASVRADHPDVHARPFLMFRRRSTSSTCMTSRRARASSSSSSRAASPASP